MTTTQRAIALAILPVSFAMTGCVAPTGLGRDFSAEALAELPLGQSTPETVRRALGIPMAGDPVSPSKTATTYWYYAYRAAPASKTDCYSDKAAMVVFRGGQLMSYELTMKIVPPSSDQVGSLRAGVTSRAGVISALGRPTEQSAFQAEKADAPGSVGYSWNEPTDPSDTRRHLSIQLDKKDIMIGKPVIDHNSPELPFWMCSFPQPVQATP